MWARHIAQQRDFCHVIGADDSRFSTGCRGSFSVKDVAQFELDDNPPPSKRCRACVQNEADRTAPLFQFDQSEDE